MVTVITKVCGKYSKTLKYNYVNMVQTSDMQNGKHEVFGTNNYCAFNFAKTY